MRSPSDSSSPSATSTRDRLIEHAGRLFAERGYAGTPVRSICEQARVNVGAVSYHFGSKRGLYLEALRYAFEHQRELVFPPPWPPADGSATPPALSRSIAGWVHQFLTSLIGSDAPDWIFHIVLREMLEPSDAMDVLVRETFVPFHSSAVELFRAALPAADAETLSLWVFAVIGQCLHYRISRVPIQRLLATECYTPELIGRIARHIAHVILAALGLPDPDGGGENLR